MLFHEIAPYADGHMDAVKTMREMIQEKLDAEPSDSVTFTRAELEVIAASLRDTSHAIYRFRQCAIDEWKMKERLETRVRTCRLEHRDK